MYVFTFIDSLVNKKTFRLYCLKNCEKYELLSNETKVIKKLLKIKMTPLTRKRYHLAP